MRLQSDGRQSNKIVVRLMKEYVCAGTYLFSSVLLLALA
jgi:hypothetical protein